jgi:large subunit ribosomal protein L2
LLQKNKRNAIIRLPSGEQYVVQNQSFATIGVMSNPEHANRIIGKAGRSRWLSRRPVVRGVAMNPVDHPHGGGEGKTSGGRPSVTPWGKPTKGRKTRNIKKSKRKF